MGNWIWKPKVPENEPKKRKLEEMESDHGSKCESDQPKVTLNEP